MGCVSSRSRSGPSAATMRKHKSVDVLAGGSNITVHNVWEPENEADDDDGTAEDGAGQSLPRAIIVYHRQRHTRRRRSDRPKIPRPPFRGSSTSSRTGSSLDQRAVGPASELAKPKKFVIVPPPEDKVLNLDYSVDDYYRRAKLRKRSEQVSGTANSKGVDPDSDNVSSSMRNEIKNVNTSSDAEVQAPSGMEGKSVEDVSSITSSEASALSKSSDVELEKDISHGSVKGKSPELEDVVGDSKAESSCEVSSAMGTDESSVAGKDSVLSLECSEELDVKKIELSLESSLDIPRSMHMRRKSKEEGSSGSEGNASMGSSRSDPTNKKVRWHGDQPAADNSFHMSSADAMQVLDHSMIMKILKHSRPRWEQNLFNETGNSGRRRLWVEYRATTETGSSLQLASYRLPWPFLYAASEDRLRGFVDVVNRLAEEDIFELRLLNNQPMGCKVSDSFDHDQPAGSNGANLDLIEEPVGRRTSAPIGLPAVGNVSGSIDTLQVTSSKPAALQAAVAMQDSGSTKCTERQYSTVNGNWLMTSGERRSQEGTVSPPIQVYRPLPIQQSQTSTAERRSQEGIVPPPIQVYRPLPIQQSQTSTAERRSQEGTVPPPIQVYRPLPIQQSQTSTAERRSQEGTVPPPIEVYRPLPIQQSQTSTADSGESISVTHQYSSIGTAVKRVLTTVPISSQQVLPAQLPTALNKIIQTSCGVAGERTYNVATSTSAQTPGNGLEILDKSSLLKPPPVIGAKTPQLQSVPANRLVLPPPSTQARPDSHQTGLASEQGPCAPARATHMRMYVGFQATSTYSRNESGRNIVNQGNARMNFFDNVPVVGPSSRPRSRLMVTSTV